MGEIAKFTYGFTDKAKDSGNARFIRITDINDDGLLNPDGAKYVDLSAENDKYKVKKGDLLMARTGATYGKTLFVSNDAPAIYASFLIKIELNNSLILNRFYWHFSKSTLYWEQANSLVSKAGQPQFNSNALCKVKIQVPSIAMQQRIVNVLDNFDAICSDLKIGLPAEIDARKKQYEYYRDKLLSFDTNVNNILHGGGNRQDEIKLLQYVFGYAHFAHFYRLSDRSDQSDRKFEDSEELNSANKRFGIGEPTGLVSASASLGNRVVEPTGFVIKKLGEIAEIAKGIQFNKENMSNQGSYPVINGGINPSGYIEQYNQNENTITISQGGASAGYVNWIKTKFWAGAHCYVLKTNETIAQNRYVFHFLKSKEYKLQECQYGAGIPALSKSTVAEITIPLPPLSEQERIVKILDRFEKLVASTGSATGGIPAEIEARKKQYEYYRDKLLSFRQAQ